MLLLGAQQFPTDCPKLYDVQSNSPASPLNSEEQKIDTFYLGYRINHLSMVVDVTPYLLNPTREDDDPLMSSRALDRHPTGQSDHR